MLRRIFKGILISSFMLVSLMSYQVYLLKNSPIDSWARDPVADCAVALTGGQNRLREGLDLLSRGQIKKLILSGVVPSASLRDIFPLWPFQGNVNESDVILERRSTTTYGNAQQSLPIVEALSCRDIILITSSFHMPRAYKTFRAKFPEEIKIISYSVFSGRSEADIFDLLLEVVKTDFYFFWAFS